MAQWFSKNNACLDILQNLLLILFKCAFNAIITDLMRREKRSRVQSCRQSQCGYACVNSFVLQCIVLEL